MTDSTPRLALPLLVAGQAQKEVFHNEALALLDLAVQASVAALAVNDPATAPAPGDAWIVGASPTGAWSGHASAIAGWTTSGWRFVAPVEGMAVWSCADEMVVRYRHGAWQRGVVTADRLVIDAVPVVGAQQPAITTPAAGSTIDAEARTAIAAILAALRAHGLIAA